MEKIRAIFPLLVLLLLASIASAATAIGGCPYQINSSGSYSLSGNLSVNNSTCITVNASDVAIDCGGFTLTGSNSSGTYGIYAFLANRTNVSNCNVQIFTAGIYYGYVVNGTIRNNNVTTSHKSETTCSNCAIYLYQSRFVNITNNYARSMTAGDTNSQDAGVFLYYSSNNIVAYNNASGVMRGLVVTWSQNNSVLYNTAGSQTNGALSIYHYSYNTYALGNNATSASGAAFDGYQSWNSTFVNSTLSSSSGCAFSTGDAHYNTISGGAYSSGSNWGVCTDFGDSYNTYDGLNVTGANGLSMWDSKLDTIRNSVVNVTGTGAAFTYSYSHYLEKNKFYTTSGNVISVGGGTRDYNNTFANNTFSSVSGNLVTIAATCTNNTFYLNNFTNTSGYYYQDNNGTSLVTYHGKGNIWANVMNG
ncbi:Right handed beta helix region [uncultured archaeon]|nr:Right handed beta helix region [uncultured archaeon]